jgi:hypothetical protein
VKVGFELREKRHNGFEYMDLILYSPPAPLSGEGKGEGTMRYALKGGRDDEE